MRSYRFVRRRRSVSLCLAALLILAAGAVGWIVGRMGAVDERPDIVLAVYRHDLGRTVEMGLEEYVRGVVAAEMPATFHLEALKAQAVAARTLALRLWLDRVPLSHQPDAIISTDPSTHQAWLSDEQLREKWGGLAYFWFSEKVNRAVAQTRGLVLTYNGEVIYPAYHASSGGRTEDSENYWTTFVPYLRSVEDPYVAGTPYEETFASIPLAEVAAAVGERLDAAGERPFIEVLSRFPSGRVASVRVGGRVLTGRELREALGLRSNWFEVELDEAAAHFRVRGYGHGVGMSQYGAAGMAEAGYRFDQILAHYYTGVEIVSWYD